MHKSTKLNSTSSWFIQSAHFALLSYCDVSFICKMIKKKISLEIITTRKLFILFCHETIFFFQDFLINVKLWKHFTALKTNRGTLDFSSPSGVLDRRNDRILSFSSSFSASSSVRLWASAKLSTAIAKKTFSKISITQLRTTI